MVPPVKRLPVQMYRSMFTSTCAPGVVACITQENIHLLERFKLPGKLCNETQPIGCNHHARRPSHHRSVVSTNVLFEVAREQKNACL